MKKSKIRAVALLIVLSALAAQAQEATPTAPAVVEPPATIDPPPVAPVSPVTEAPAPIAPPLESAPATTVPPATDAAGGPIATDAGAVSTNTSNVNDFQGDEVGTVLRLLARQASINLIVSDKVTGTVTMRLVGKLRWKRLRSSQSPRIFMWTKWMVITT